MILERVETEAEIEQYQHNAHQDIRQVGHIQHIGDQVILAPLRKLASQN